MKTTYKPLPKSQALVSITMTEDEVQPQIDAVIKKLGERVEIKGFRKGNAPRRMIVDSLGLGRIQQEALDTIMQLGYMKALQEHKFAPVSQPAVALKKFNLKPDATCDGPLEYELTIDLMPNVTLGDYSKITIDKKILDQDNAVSKDEVDKIIDHLRRQKSTMTDIPGPVKAGDWVELSFAGSIDKVAQEKMTSKNHPLIIGSNTMVPGFEDALIGMEIDKPKTFSVTFPKDYYSKEFAGKKAEFTATIHKIKKINLPELNDAFATSYGHPTAIALRQAISKELEVEKQEQKKQAIETTVLEQVRKLLKVELPQGLVHQEIHRIIERMRESIEKQGLSFDRYLDSLKKTHDDLHNDYEPQAIANIEVGLLLGEVIKKEKLKAEDEQAPRKAMDKLIEIATKNSQAKKSAK